MDAAISPAERDAPRSHLVVLVHGVAGLASDLNYLNSLLSARPQLVVLAPRCNEPLLKPFEGIVAGGERLVACILEAIAALPSLRKLSLIGHSLGGLYIRYAAGILYGRCGCTLEPASLITLATPHLGVRRPLGRPLMRGGGFNGLFNLVAERLCSQLGLELTLEDDADEPLLLQLCKGPYLHALRRFGACWLYANVFNDFLVPYCTASIQPYNPYRRGEQPLTVSPLYPHITLASLYRLALRLGQPPAPAIAPTFFPHATGRELPRPDDTGPLVRALTPLSSGALQLEAAIDAASACAARASGVRALPSFARSLSAPAAPGAALDGGRLARRAPPPFGAGLARTASGFVAPLFETGGVSRALSCFAPHLESHARARVHGAGGGVVEGRGVVEGVREAEDEALVEAGDDGANSGLSPSAPARTQSGAREPESEHDGAAEPVDWGRPSALPDSNLAAVVAVRAAASNVSGVSGASLAVGVTSSAPIDTTGWDFSFGSQEDPKRGQLLHMLFCLNSVRWARVDCLFHSPAAHEQIINKNAWTKQLGFDTGDVCRHVDDMLRA
ncbi:hypothetical protein KFE25_000622 [Diacronema lutheri]|uniref:DUF676 domain-containing protein n=2 Tax=Diacronema lutheri TaxID=2081491 RepID=A0A8J5XEJ2_DIALT|nr:hypothetical protein KFE25_000622 [Diacronema lutheri]